MNLKNQEETSKHGYDQCVSCYLKESWTNIHSKLIIEDTHVGLGGWRLCFRSLL